MFNPPCPSLPLPNYGSTFHLVTDALQIDALEEEKEKEEEAKPEGPVVESVLKAHSLNSPQLPTTMASASLPKGPECVSQAEVQSSHFLSRDSLPSPSLSLHLQRVSGSSPVSQLAILCPSVADQDAYNHPWRAAKPLPAPVAVLTLKRSPLDWLIMGHFSTTPLKPFSALLEEPR